MKHFYTGVGLALAALLINAGCDYLGSDVNDGSPNTGGAPGDVGIAIAAVGPGPIQGLQDAISAMAARVDEVINNNEACIAPSPDMDSVNARLDSLLSLLGDGINRHTFPDHFAGIDAEMWASLDSVAVAALAEDYRAIKEDRDRGCPENEELRRMANDLFAEYVNVINQMGLPVFLDLVRTTLVQPAQGKCERSCDWDYIWDAVGILGLHVVMSIGCVALAAVPVVGVGGAVACIIGAGVYSTAQARDAKKDRRACKEACKNG